MLNFISAVISENKSAVRELSDAIWSHPETAYEEYFASETLKKFLEDRGFEVTLPYCGVDTAFYCEFKNGDGPTAAIAAEYDALPEIGHGCGHNLIAAAGVAAFIAGVETMKARNIQGKLILFGTPAEEGGGGKVKMTEANCLDGVDCVIMVHPSLNTTPDCGSTANIGMEVIFHGRNAHAAAYPEKGINALDAVNLVFTGVNTLRQYIPEHARMHGVIIDGGHVPNIIPDYARCHFYLRSGEEDYIPEIERRFRNIVKGAELMTDATAEINYFRPTYRSRKPNKVMNEEYIRCMKEQGVEVVIPPRPGRGSSDFGNFSQVIPGIHPYFEVSPQKPTGHSAEFSVEAGKDYGFENAMKAAAAQSEIVCRFLSDTDFRNAVIEDFKK